MVKVAFIEKGRVEVTSALREEMENPLWDMVKIGHIQP